MQVLGLRRVMNISAMMYCIVSIHLYSASSSAHQSEALPVRETQGEESSLERAKRGTWLTGLGPPFPGAAIPSIRYFRITNNNNHPSPKNSSIDPYSS